MGVVARGWWERKMAQPLWKTVGQLPTKRNIVLSLQPAMVLLGIYPVELTTYIHTYACTWMFLAALFVIAKTGSNRDVLPEENG